ncbi:MAG: hypothetical protein ACOYW3_03395, partial [Bacteroidota bacterium]
MKIFKISLSLLITAALIYALDRSWGQIPPLGRFLDPFGGFWQNAERNSTSSTTLELPGLTAEVSVYYD